MRRGEATTFAGRCALSALVSFIRRTESSAVPAVSMFVANSTAVRDRIRNWWQRDAPIVHPPVDTDHYTVDDAVRLVYLEAVGPHENFYRDLKRS